MIKLEFKRRAFSVIPITQMLLMVIPVLRRQISRTVKVQIQKHSFLNPKSNVSSSPITEKSGHLKERIFRGLLQFELCWNIKCVSVEVEHCTDKWATLSLRCCRFTQPAATALSLMR